MNIRAVFLTFALLLSAFIAPTAGAVEFDVIGATIISVSPGEPFTINIALDNTSGTSNNGVVGEITGMAAGGITVLSGTTAQVHFVQFCTATTCFGGILNNDNNFFDSSNLAGGSYTPGDDLVRIVSSLAQFEVIFDGALDPGLAGVFGQHDPNDVEITMSASTEGTFDLEIGGTFSQSGNNPITSTATFTVIVPEPSAIATSLVSLGAVFAWVGIRRRC